MIDGLVSGRLYGTAQVRTGQHGTHFVTCRVRASAGDGESLFVNVIAFDDTVKDALQALDDGDSVSLAGALTPKTWIDKQGNAKPALDMVVHAVLTAYHVQRKRRLIRGEAGQTDPHGSDDLDDDEV
ncbi:Single-strand binding protein family protein [Burkholderia sp. D7]|jgi:single-stranded DNA-binding protein|nr:Single-strand binding protein family protein [Burkholderia sp. D7]